MFTSRYKYFGNNRWNAWLLYLPVFTRFLNIFQKWPSSFKKINVVDFHAFKHIWSASVHYSYYPPWCSDFLISYPSFFFLSFMIPFLPFSLLYLPNVTYELSITQLAFAPNCLFTPLTPERRVFEWTKYKLYSALCQLWLCQRPVGSHVLESGVKSG